MDMAISPQYLRQQGLLLFRHLPPDLGDLVDLGVEEAVLGPIRLHVILEKKQGGSVVVPQTSCSGEVTLKGAAKASFLEKFPKLQRKGVW